MPKTTAEKKVAEKEEVAQETTKKECCPTCGRPLVPKKYNRLQAAADSIKALGDDADFNDLTRKATELYVAKGGKKHSIDETESNLMGYEIKHLRSTMALLKERGLTA